MNGFGRSSREQAEFEKHHYPGTEVLRNKLNLRDRRQLELAERYFSALRARQGFPGVARMLNVTGIKAIHRHLFQDVYEWAGEFRPFTTGRSNAPFATPENIQPWLEQQFTALSDENMLENLDAGRFAARAAYYVNEINAAHPFIEGNGRAQRAWLRILADHAGYHIRLRSGDRARWYDASRIGFEKSDPASMAELIFNSIVHQRPESAT